MGSTTKQGRTRNRRKTQLAQPPGGWPLLLVWGEQTRIDGLNYTFAITGPNGEPWNSSSIIVTGPINVYFRSLQTWTTAVVGWSGTNLLTVQLDTNMAEGDEIVVPAWQETYRGPNGEWFAPLQWNALPE